MLDGPKVAQALQRLEEAVLKLRQTLGDTDSIDRIRRAGQDVRNASRDLEDTVGAERIRRKTGKRS